MTTAAKIPQLGNTVRDTITGYTGIAAQQLELISGTIQFAVQPKIDKKAESGKYPDATNIDVQMLEFVDDGVAARVTQPTAIIPFELGNTVKDTVTGFTGIATGKHTFINGCVYFSVTPPMSKEDKEKGTQPEAGFFDAGRLARTGKGVAQSYVKAPEVEKTKERPGGPSTRARRAN